MGFGGHVLLSTGDKYLEESAIEALVDGLEAGLAHQTLLGVTGSGKTFTIANVIQSSQRPTMILAPNKTLAAQLYGEMKELFPNNSVEYFVSYYDYYQPEAYVPASDTFIEKDASINEHIEQMRLSATKALIERPDTIIVATVSAIYGLGDPESYFNMVLHLYEERRAVGYFRKFAAGYTKRHPQRKTVLLAMMAAITKQDVYDIVEQWYSEGSN